MAAKIFRLKRKRPAQGPAEVYPVRIFKEIEDSLNIIEDLDQIGLNFLGKIKEIIPIEKQVLLVFDQDLGRFKVETAMGYGEAALKNVAFPSASPLPKWLKINKTYFSRRDQPGVEAFLTAAEKEILAALDVAVCYPLVSMNRLIGMHFVGPRTDGRDLSRQDLALIASLMPQTGIALENALLYREQRVRFRRMMRADKLATIGELAAGAAHEIRNPLTAIKSSLQYLEDKTGDATSRRLLGTALEETGRIEEILSGLLSFSRPTEMQKEDFDLLEALEESLELIAFEARKKKVRLVREFAAGPLTLRADKSQLKQVFLNLFLNSLQAMPRGGEIKLEAGLADPHRAVVAVTDTGEGIAEEDLDRIFDPFFTTKKGGTGLGLSICYGIVKSHAGEIEVKSRPGKGTTVVVKVPVGG